MTRNEAILATIKDWEYLARTGHTKPDSWYKNRVNGGPPVPIRL